MTKFAKKALLATTVSMMALAGCAKAPQTAPAPGNQPAQPQPILVNDPGQLKPVGGGNPPPAAVPGGDAGYWNFDCRFIAFEAAMSSDELSQGVPNTSIGNLFLYDEVLKDVYVVNAAIAGLTNGDLTESTQTVDGITDNTDLNKLNPYAFADGKILFEFGQFVYYYDIYSEERVTVAFDGRDSTHGGSHPVVTGDGAVLAYINNQGLVVLKLLDGDYYTKTRVLSKIAAEAQFLGEEDDEGHDGAILDIDISDDGKWLVLSIDGILYLYDVANPRLNQILPLGSTALAGRPQAIGHVAISFDGRYVAFTVDDTFTTVAHGTTVNASTTDFNHADDERLLVLDRATGYIDTVPYANLGDMDTDDFVANPIFCGQQLLFETKIGGFWKVWKYDIETELLRALVILNNALGDVGADVKISNPNLKNENGYDD